MDTIEYRVLASDPRYRVGSDGSVWSRCNGKWGLREKWEPLIPVKVRSRQCKDYARLMVCIGRDNRRYVHQLVLEAFSGERPPGCESCHRNGIPTDNRAENLYWGTRDENNADVARHGRKKGERHHNAILNDDLVRSIRKRIADGERRQAVADDIGIGVRHVCSIVNRQQWSHVQ